MCKLRFGAIAAAILVVTWSAGSNAVAADMQVKAPTISTPSWTGFYVGASVGARVAENDWRTTNVLPNIPFVSVNPLEQTFTSAAARFGGYAGYNWQLAPRWVVGVEGYGGFANNRNSLDPIPGSIGISYVIDPLVNNPVGAVKEDWDAGIRARIGYLVNPNTLIYATGGGSWMRVALQARCPSFGSFGDFCSVDEGISSVSKTMGAWTVGAGMEYRITANWTARADYQYADYGELSHTFLSAGPFPGGSKYDDRIAASVNVHTHTATIGIGYKF